MKFLSKYISGCFYSGSNKISAVAEDEETIKRPSKIIQVSCGKVKALVENSSNVIGEGGYSTVHLIRFPNKLEAAVKVHEPSKRLYSMFRKELDVFLHVNNSHPNIVRLLGYGDDGESSGVLVMEHVQHRTLHHMLHEQHGTTAKMTLSWSQRVSIAYQIAMALEHLHEHCDLPIIHGDVKASNVLLDQNINPKLCDFGSARLEFSDMVSRSINHNNMMMGSPGYTDPSFFRSGLVSKKSDMYSFGVLVLELITGLEPFSPKNTQLLATMMRPQLKLNSHGVERIGKMIDAKLGKSYNGKEVTVMMKIAEKCIAENPTLRPSVGEVIKIMGDNMSSSIRLVHTCTPSSNCDCKDFGKQLLHV